MSHEFALRPRGPSHSFRRRFDLSVAASARRGQDQDLKLFVLSFTAFFICTYTLIF